VASSSGSTGLAATATTAAAAGCSSLGLLERALEAVFAAEPGVGPPRQDLLSSLPPRLALAADGRHALVQRLGGSPALRHLVRLKRHALTALAPPRPSRAVAKIAFLLRAQGDDHQPSMLEQGWHRLI
jgi:hypothetical protein